MKKSAVQTLAMAVEGIKANYEIPRVSGLSEIDFHNKYFRKEGWINNLLKPTYLLTIYLFYTSSKMFIFHFKDFSCSWVKLQV